MTALDPFCGDDLPRRLARRLERPLPGRQAMSRFAPALSYGRHYGPVPHDARPAAVLLLLYPHQGARHVPLTVRPDTMAAHAGQVGLAGGVMEPGERTADCARRQHGAELGASGAGVEHQG